MAIVTLNGSPFHTVGSLPEVGSKAPAFNLTKSDLSEITLENYAGKKIILNIFPSLDTPTCAAAMRHFNEIAGQLKNALVLCVSADLPFAQKRFCIAEHLDNVTAASVFRDRHFGNDYGILISDGALQGLLARSVVIIDESGHVIYTELVKEISNEPNYETMLAILNRS